MEGGVGGEGRCGWRGGVKDGDVNVLPVSVKVSHPHTRKLCQFFNGAHTHHFCVVFRHPQRDGSAPIPIPRYRPVTCILQPVVESFLFHKVWNPSKEER